MKKIIIRITCLVFALSTFTFSYAQKVEEIKNWYNGGGAGMYTNAAYKKLKKKKSTTVIVAVIDSGIDIEHKDLQGKIWTNTKEIPGNNIDDDKNGYVDDIHGWNFLGNSKGENVDQANLEKTRLLRELGKKFEGVDPLTLTASQMREYNLYKEVKMKVEQERLNYTEYKRQTESLPERMKQVPATVASILGKENYTIDDLKKWNPTTGEQMQLKGLAMAMMMGQLTLEDVEGQLKYLNDQLDYYLNTGFNERILVGDDPENFAEIGYGNSDVEGPDALHGTHVGGIIGAIRGNGLGGDGVADNILLMSLRAVPNGDENDKDIALAIRYAVDNGAKVINMSFGKAYSPHQKEVYEAMLYASSKGVLLVHAAGNDAKNVDVEPNFPSAMYSFQKQKLDLYLTIGASTRNAKGNLAADFSNYGQKYVDVFAPGHEIYNSVPQSEYKILQGTSMAAPMVSGVAALLASYFPSLTMLEIKEIILKSATPYKGTKQTMPGKNEKIDFGILSVTGAVVNVKNAVKMCKELEKSKMN